MKATLFSFLLLYIAVHVLAQTPQVFQYQAVVRDASGTALVNQSVNFQLSIISGNVSGPVEYTETHSASTNAYGIVTLNVGGGNPVTGTFNSISWGTNLYFIKVEADPTGGTSYLDMGTTQLLSVPYALYAETTGQVYTAGTGISISGNVVTNDSPDQVVNLNSGTGVQVSGTYPNYTIDNSQPDQPVNLTGTGSTTVSGAYPNFTINSTDNNTTYTAGSGLSLTGTTFANTAPDQTVNLTQGGATTITGTYPNFTISSTDNNTTYSAGTGLNLIGTTFTNAAPDQSVNLTQGGATTITGTYPNFTISSTDLNTGTPGGLNKTIQYNNSGVFAGDTAAMVWDNANKRLGVGISNPSGRVVIKGSSTAPANEPLFEIKNAQGQQVMAVYNDSIHFFITDIGANQGGFAVSGRNNAKALTNDFLRINAEKTRIWTSDTLQGFGVRNIGTSSKTSYMQLTPSNYFIGHESGDNIDVAAGGLYNCFYGYQSGKNTTSGNRNVANGYQSLYLNTTGVANVANGFQALYSNNSDYNVATGFRSMYNNTGGTLNVANGYQSLFNNTVGAWNVAIGYNALYSNISGVANVANGYEALYYNNANYNVATGYMAMHNNTSGTYNVANGFNALTNNTTGNKNTATGMVAMLSNTTGSENTATGNSALNHNTTGSQNVATGNEALYNNTTGFDNVANGHQSLYSNTIGNYNVANGFQALYSNVDGSNNNAYGYKTLYSNNSGSFNVANGYQALYFNNNNSNVATGYQALYNNTTGTQNTAEGYQAMYNNTTGSTNVGIGNLALYNNTTYNANVAIGDQAAYYAVGGANTAVGQWTLFQNTGSNNTALGFGAFFSWSPISYANSTALGYQAVITASNQVRIGTNSVTSIGGQVGWTTLSDGRFKKNIQENVPGLEFIKRLKPITYNVDLIAMEDFLNVPDTLRKGKDYQSSINVLHTGFIAQDVEKAATELGFDFSGVDKPKNEGDYYGLRYSEFTVPLVKAVQELNSANIVLKKTIEDQSIKMENMQKQIDELKSLIK